MQREPKSVFKELFKHKVWRKVLTPLAYRREQQEIARLEQLAESINAFFSKLPKCTGKVLVASPIYQDRFLHERHRFQPESMAGAEWRGEVFIHPGDLASFVVAQYKDRCIWKDSQIWRDAFVAWLEDADLSIESASLIPDVLHSEVLDLDFPDMLKQCPLELFCWECRKVFPRLIYESNFLGFRPGWIFWEEYWRCEVGHLVHKQIEEMHVHGFWRATTANDSA